MSKQCFEQAHMTCAEFGLWKQYMMMAYASGRLFCDGRKTADRFAGESKDHIYRLRKSLIEKGWLVTTKHSGVDKKTGRRTAAEFTVLDHAAWVKKHGTKLCKTSLFSGIGPVAPVQMVEEKPVAPVQTACRTSANGPVAPARHSSKENQLQSKNKIQSLANAKLTPPENEKDGRQSTRVAEPNVPPVAPVQMAEAPAVSEAGSHASLESFPRLNWERGYGWCAARNMGALTAVETAEMNRRNALRITPQEVA